jgi:3-deoxy-D-manno-octulosonate 8-phosphate phosphatase (KDO 8-P phosphatase)
VELKGVNTQDGIALAWLVKSGIDTGIISGRVSDGIREQARMMKMKYVIQGTMDKIPPLERILRQSRLRPEQVAYMGDDLPDIPVLKRVGWAAVPANARPEARRAAHYICRAEGGQGAVREVAETILKAQGLWKGIVKQYSA